ncbi:MAG: ATP-dependent Clp protease proteolytic subunit [Clostridiales bacterium]|nr:ATP-dependent Clp protease proteolytic subunit [Clostridiales bacterium]
MYAIAKSSSGITLIPIESRLLAERKVFLKGEITADSAGEFMQEVMYLVNEDAGKPIDIYINSPGGSVNDAGLMLYDFIKGLKTEVNLHCVGMAASMAAILMASGPKGHRYILPHGGMMIHEPLIAGGVGGSATSIWQTAENIMEKKRVIVELLSADTGKSREEVEEAISFDNFMNAEEAIAFGLCDHIETSIA